MVCPHFVNPANRGFGVTLTMILQWKLREMAANANPNRSVYADTFDNSTWSSRYSGSSTSTRQKFRWTYNRLSIENTGYGVRGSSCAHFPGLMLFFFYYFFNFFDFFSPSIPLEISIEDLQCIYLLALWRQQALPGTKYIIGKDHKFLNWEISSRYRCSAILLTFRGLLNRHFNSPVAQPSPMLFANHHFSARREYPISRHRLVIDNIP